LTDASADSIKIHIRIYYNDLQYAVKLWIILGINDKKENNFSEKVASILLRHRIRFQEGHWKPNVLLH